MVMVRVAVGVLCLAAVCLCARSRAVVWVQARTMKLVDTGRWGRSPARGISTPEARTQVAPFNFLACAALSNEVVGRHWNDDDGHGPGKKEGRGDCGWTVTVVDN